MEAAGADAARLFIGDLARKPHRQHTARRGGEESPFAAPANEPTSALVIQPVPVTFESCGCPLRICTICFPSLMVSTAPVMATEQPRLSATDFATATASFFLVRRRGVHALCRHVQTGDKRYLRQISAQDGELYLADNFQRRVVAQRARARTHRVEHDRHAAFVCAFARRNHRRNRALVERTHVDDKRGGNRTDVTYLTDVVRHNGGRADGEHSVCHVVDRHIVCNVMDERYVCAPAPA